MNLFNTESATNLLPYDGEAIYHGIILKQQETRNYLQALLNSIEWKNDEVIIYGKHITTKRKTAWYGDSNFSYTYSNVTRQALIWTKELLELKNIVEKASGTNFNSCLLNLYHNGDEGMSWHSDDEKPLGKNTVIASLSLGAERRFLFKHKLTKQKVSVVLENGSLLVMQGATQTYWQHSLPKTAKIKKQRVNLTFRIFLTVEDRELR